MVAAVSLPKIASGHRFLPMKRPIRSRFRSIRDVELQRLGELKRELDDE